MNDFRNRYSGVPEFTPPIVMTEQPNQSIYIIREKEFLLKTVEKDISIFGNIEFKWQPQLAVYFEGKVDRFPLLSDEGTFKVSTSEGKVLGEAFTIREGYENNQYFVEGIFSRECILGDPLISVNEVRFVIPNMRRFDGKNITIGSKLYRGRINLNHEGRELILDQLPDFRKREEELRKTGGYNITYSGKFIFEKPKNLKELQKEIDILNCFLQLLNGKQVSGIFYTGMHEGEIIWQDYRSHGVESFHSRGYTCLPQYSINQADIEGMQKIYGNLIKFWKNDNHKSMIKSAVSWYLEANTKPWYQNTGMIVSQSALEMFYNWHLIEKEKILRGQVKLSAANKIRLLLSKVGVGNEVPEKYEEITKYLSSSRNSNEEDAIDAVVLYRNAIVHGEYEKRSKLNNLSLGFKEQAQDLSIWYLELCLLYTLGYNGKYSDRTTAKYVNDTEIVPWMKKTE